MTIEKAVEILQLAVKSQYDGDPKDLETALTIAISWLNFILLAWSDIRGVHVKVGTN